MSETSRERAERWMDGAMRRSADENRASLAAEFDAAVAEARKSVAEHRKCPECGAEIARLTGHANLYATMEISEHEWRETTAQRESINAALADSERNP